MAITINSLYIFISCFYNIHNLYNWWNTINKLIVFHVENIHSFGINITDSLLNSATAPDYVSCVSGRPNCDMDVLSRLDSTFVSDELPMIMR